VSKDNAECNRLVNEQAQISLLLAGPGVMATLTFAPLVVALFYSTKFGAAVGLLRWICLGMTLRVVAWPMGFILVAKGEQKIFFWTEVAATLVHVGLAWLFVTRFGLNGSGAAFFGLYVWHGLLIYTIVRRLSGFRWSSANIQTGLLFLPLTGLVFLGFYVFPLWLALMTGVVAVLASSVYSIKTLLKLVPLDRLPSSIRQPLVRLGFAPAAVDVCTA
jgi:PST family polysaccharide transporter